MGFLIANPTMELEIKLEEIEKLHLSEDFIPRIFKQLSREIKQGICRHPIIVDKGTHVVLDGTHRVAVLEHLGYRLVPACLVDYNNPSIKVESWFRTVENKEKTSENLGKDLEEMGYSLQEFEDDELKRKMCDREIVIGVVTPAKRYGISKNVESTRKIYEYLKLLEKNLESIGYKISYETGDDSLDKVNSGRAIAAIFAPRISKKDVVTAALSGEVFVHKSTRHVIPARPLFVNVPIEWLNMDAREANKLLLQHLSKKKIRHLPPGQTIDRRYEEELYIFSDT